MTVAFVSTKSRGPPFRGNELPGDQTSTYPRTGDRAGLGVVHPDQAGRGPEIADRHRRSWLVCQHSRPTKVDHPTDSS